jgi:hypothetical protein
MWRWIIRSYVSVMLFWVLMFSGGVALREVDHLSLLAGSSVLSRWCHAHVLWTLFLLGIMAGQVSLGSNFTGEGWFRSKDGQTYEGFKLEELKPWTWLLVSPLFLLGVVMWCLEKNESGVFSSLSFESFYHDFLMPNCSNVGLRAYQFNISCGMQLLFVGFWMASIGYSLAPIVRKHGAKLFRSLRFEPEATIPMEDRREDSMEKKADL